MHNAKRTIAICLVLCLLLSVLPVSALAINITTKPANGTTVGQPFAPGTGGSKNFRIPGIVTLDNGTLVAACDARWNHSGDGAGLDTIVSVSTDNGANWEYTFANYLGDNGDTYNNLSTCIIDPGIGTDGTTAYLIADLWPAGIALNTSKYAPVSGQTGYDENGNLALRDVANDTVAIGGDGYNRMAAKASYDYYLDLQTLELCRNDGTVVEGYTVDAYFNITGNGVNTNLFFSDSPYQPYPTDYLYMTKSTDGLNWSEPELLNLKEANEQTLLIGPGNGTYDAVNDRMIFTGYEHSSGYERTSLIWMDSEGNWYRSEDCTVNNWSSEASSVILDDGTVRVFYRDGFSVLRYTDMIWSESQQNYVRDPQATEVSTTAAKKSGCQLTTILYSQPIDGKDAIIVATPANSGSRADGFLYVFLVDDDNSMELKYAYDITPNATEYYAYSCLTELNNGDLGLLWESAGAGITYTTIEMANVATRENDPTLTFKSVELLTGDSKTYLDHSGYHGDADLSELDTDVAELTLLGEETITDAAQLGSNVNFDGNVIDLTDCLYTFTKGENDRWSASALKGTVYLYPGNTNNTGYPNREAAYANLSITEGYQEGTFCIMSNDCDNANQSTSYLYFDRSGLRWDRVSDPGSNVQWQNNVSLCLYKAVAGSGSAEIPGYEPITSMDELVDGEYLVVGKADNGSWYALYPNTSTANRYCQLAKLLGRTTVGYTELIFTGVGAGYTEVQVGNTVYKVTVADVTEVVLNIPVGTTATVTEPNGNYADADTSALDQSVATVNIVGSDGTTSTGLSPEPVDTVPNGTYVIVNTRANKLVNNTSASAEAGAGSMGGLRLDGYIHNFNAEIAIWTFTAVEGGYTIQDVNGKYMSIDRNAAGLQDEPHTIHVERNGSTWVLEENNAYLNDAAGAGTTASGWQDPSARGDVGSQFDIYSYSEQSYGPSTELTFTGVYPGSTELLIGRTKYLINVTGEIHDVQLNVGESESFTVSGDLTGADLSKLDTAIADIKLEAGYIVHPGTGEGYEDSYLTLEDCLYTFDATDDGYFEVSATTADGTVVYLNHYTTAISQIPNCSTPGKIDVRSSNHENMFKLVAKSLDGAGSDRGLHFHTEKAFPHWNRCGNDTSAKCHEYLVRFDANGNPVLVTSLDEVVDGGKYLIGHMDEQGKMYVLVPSTDMNSWFSHVGLVSEATVVTFTGVAAGETGLTLPGHIFNITVQAAVHEHSFGDWAVTTPATCTDKGVETRTCACGETETREIDALGHNAVAVPGKDATCTETGLTEGSKCDRCGETLVEQKEIPALGHDYVDGVCIRCGDQQEIPVVNPFEDVPEDSWCAEAVLWAVEKGITSGTTDTTFSPNMNVNRAQAVTFLWAAAGKPEPASNENPFVDVVETDYFCKAVLWASENGYTSGVDATHFAPNAECLREQVVTFLWAVAGRPESSAEVSFPDVQSGAWYYAPVAWAVENKITSGMDDGTFGVGAACTRAQMVTFLYTAK